jgi:hypothetical protein
VRDPAPENIPARPAPLPGAARIQTALCVRPKEGRRCRKPCSPAGENPAGMDGRSRADPRIPKELGIRLLPGIPKSPLFGIRACCRSAMICRTRSRPGSTPERITVHDRRTRAQREKQFFQGAAAGVGEKAGYRRFDRRPRRRVFCSLQESGGYIQSAQELFDWLGSTLVPAFRERNERIRREFLWMPVNSYPSTLRIWVRFAIWFTVLRRI